MLKTCITVSLIMSTSAIEFVAMGDWGYSNDNLRETVRAIEATSPRRDFNILLGDNMYPNGVSSADDPQLRIFPDIVARETSSTHHVILGNHDYMQSIDAQISYSAVDQRWDLPARYYSRFYKIDDVNLCLIFIDTVNFDAEQVRWISEELQNLNVTRKSRGQS